MSMSPTNAPVVKDVTSSSERRSSPKNTKSLSPKSSKTLTQKSTKNSTTKSTKTPKSSNPKTPKSSNPKTPKSSNPKTPKRSNPKGSKSATSKNGNGSTPSSVKPKAHAKIPKMIKAFFKEHQEKKKREEASAQMRLEEEKEQQESKATDQPVVDTLQLEKSDTPENLSKMQKRRVDMMKSAEWMLEIGKKRKSPRKAKGAGSLDDISDSDEGDGAMNEYFLPAYHHMIDELKKINFDANQFILDTSDQCEDGVQKVLIENRLGLSKLTQKDKKEIEKLAARISKENQDYVPKKEPLKREKRGRK
mmetsp:Transcript_9737/g.32580  ORF Transcript_9737/g.32580 Transcript_9737/m.32580 type:complete len:305 (-) Transcript_9737:29-943(-)